VTIAAVALPLAVAAALVPFRTTLPSTVAVLLLVTVVVAVAANGQRVAGLLAAVSAAAWFDFFLTQPYERFAITHREDIETTVLLVAVGAAMTELAGRGRRHKSVAKTEARYLVAIRTTADLVASGASATDVITLVRRQLSDAINERSGSRCGTLGAATVGPAMVPGASSYSARFVPDAGSHAASPRSIPSRVSRLGPANRRSRGAGSLTLQSWGRLGASARGDAWGAPRRPLQCGCTVPALPVKVTVATVWLA